MSDRLLNGLVVILALGLGSVLYISDRIISRFMETCGRFISQAFGF
jgi:hypothetical protein